LDKDNLLHVVLPILVVFVFAFFKMKRKGLDTSTIYLVQNKYTHPLKSFYIMLFASLLVSGVAIMLVDSKIISGAPGTITIAILLLILQFVILFRYLYNKYYKR
jgi:hypothetical protein